MKYRWVVTFKVSDSNDSSSVSVIATGPDEALACFRRAVTRYVEAITKVERKEELI